MRNALILIILVPLAVGCGAKKSGLAGSAGALNDAGTSRVEMTITGTTPLYAATGAIDYAHDRGQLVITSKDIPGGELQGRFIGRTTYTGLTLLGKVRWLKESDYDPSGTDRFIPGPGGANPDRILGLLIKSSKNVESLGNDEIRGVSARHYRAHLDPKKLGEDVSYYGGDAIIDAWIDEDGLVRRLRIPEGGEDAGTTIVDLFDFGVEVDVEAPPADEVVSEEKFSKLIEQECALGRRSSSRENCAMSFGEGSGSGSAPIETMPRTVTEPK